MLLQQRSTIENIFWDFPRLLIAEPHMYVHCTIVHKSSHM